MAEWSAELPADAVVGAEGHPADHNKIKAALVELRGNVDAAEGTAAWGSVSGKPSTFPPADHDHAIGDVTGLQSALDGKQASGNYATTAQVNAKADQSALDDLIARVEALETPEA